jgi:hypothetical protein
MKTRKKRESSFTTLHGILLTLAIGTFVALVFPLDYFVREVPMEKFALERPPAFL